MKNKSLRHYPRPTRSINFIFYFISFDNWVLWNNLCLNCVNVFSMILRTTHKIMVNLSCYRTSMHILFGHEFDKTTGKYSVVADLFLLCCLIM